MGNTGMISKALFNKVIAGYDRGYGDSVIVVNVMMFNWDYDKVRMSVN